MQSLLPKSWLGIRDGVHLYMEKLEDIKTLIPSRGKTNNPVSASQAQKLGLQKEETEKKKKKKKMASSSTSPDEALFSIVLISFYIFAPLTYLCLQFLDAPYGKHFRCGWGPSLDPTIAWAIMESPTLFITLSIFPLGSNRSSPLALCLISFYLLHYFHRTCLYPLYLLNKPSSSVPLSIASFAFLFNLLNAYLQSRWISHYADLDLISWARVLLGSAVFFAGFALNVWSDRVLVGLKKQGKGYRMPRGGMFELVSCPNYLGELIEWLGWAIMTWSWVGFGFFLNTWANLVPRARSHRRWYLDKFPEECPRSRKAIIPLVY